MKIVKKAIGVNYRATCYGCDSVLEFTDEDLEYDGVHTVSIHCPICDMNRTFHRRHDLCKTVIYEGEEQDS